MPAGCPFFPPYTPPLPGTGPALALRSVATGMRVRPATEEDVSEALLSPYGTVWAGGEWCYVGTAELE